MSDQVQLPSYPLIESAIDAVAGWVNRHRSATRSGDTFAQCSPADTAQIATDLGLPLGEAAAIVHGRPGGTDLLRKMLPALHLDAREVAAAHPGVMRDLERLCIGCAHKKRCAHEMDAGTAASHYRDFCPNAFTLDALFAGAMAAKPH